MKKADCAKCCDDGTSPNGQPCSCNDGPARRKESVSCAPAPAKGGGKTLLAAADSLHVYLTTAEKARADGYPMVASHSERLAEACRAQLRAAEGPAQITVSLKDCEELKSKLAAAECLLGEVETGAVQVNDDLSRLREIEAEAVANRPIVAAGEALEALAGMEVPPSRALDVELDHMREMGRLLQELYAAVRAKREAGS